MVVRWIALRVVLLFALLSTGPTHAADIVAAIRTTMCRRNSTNWTRVIVNTSIRLTNAMTATVS